MFFGMDTFNCHGICSKGFSSQIRFLQASVKSRRGSCVGLLENNDSQNQQSSRATLIDICVLIIAWKLC